MDLVLVFPARCSSCCYRTCWCWVTTRVCTRPPSRTARSSSRTTLSPLCCKWIICHIMCFSHVTVWLKIHASTVILEYQDLMMKNLQLLCRSAVHLAPFFLTSQERLTNTMSHHVPMPYLAFWRLGLSCHTFSFLNMSLISCVLCITTPYFYQLCIFMWWNVKCGSSMK